MIIARCLAFMAASLTGSLCGVALVAVGVFLVGETFDLDAHSAIVFLSLALGVPLGSMIGLHIGTMTVLHAGPTSRRVVLIAGALAFAIALGSFVMLLATNHSGETFAASLCLTAIGSALVYTGGYRP